MGYVYVMSVMSAGLLSVLLLALSTEKARRAAVRQALHNFPGFESEHILFENGSGIALDRRRRVACMIASHGMDLRLTLVPFNDISGCELVRRGQRVVYAGTVPPATLADAGAPADDAGRVVVYTGAGGHGFAASEPEEALRWFRLVKRLIERGAGSALHAAPKKAAPAIPKSGTAASTAGRRGADTARSERRAAVEPAPRAPQPARPVAAPARLPSVGEGTDDHEAADRIRTRVEAVIRRHLESAPRVVISERRLRDEAGVELALLHFHRHMNRFKREKAFVQATLSYSRKDETWTIRRRQSAAAAAT
ncbi:MAG: hypothetical protein P8076_07050 [Gammaproteobacteria bacterium]